MLRNQLKIGLLAAVFSLFGGGLWAQTPGGVQATAWWRADKSDLYTDAGITHAGDSTKVQQWNDYTGHGYNLVQTNIGLSPTYSNSGNGANFNPTLTFVNQYMDFTPATGTTIIDRADGTLFAAGYQNTLRGNGFFGFHTSDDYPGLHTFNTGSEGYKLLFFTAGGPGYQGLSDNAFEEKGYFVAGASWENGLGQTPDYLNATVSLDGSHEVYSGTNKMYNVNMTPAAEGVRIGWDSNYGPLDGELNDLMIFENPLNATEMRQVESYLAIKYGKTLANGTVDYLNSNGVTVWDATTNDGYNNFIAGIARDDNGELDQRQSWSTEGEKQILISTTGLNNSNAANGNSLSDGQYLIWGDNGEGKTPTVAINNISGVNFRFAAVWKVQNNNGVGVVRIAWPKNYENLKLIQNNGDPTFNSGNIVTDMGGNTITINGVDYNYADVTLADGQYFTLAADVPAPGGVAAAAWWKADASANVYKDAGSTVAADQDKLVQWNDMIEGYPLVQTTASVQPVYSNTTTLANFNPTVTFLNNWMDYISPAGEKIIDRADGTLFTAGYQNNLRGNGFFGFDASDDFPGLHSFASGSGYKLLFFTSGGPGYQGLSDNFFTDKDYFIAGAGWTNNAGNPPASYLGATVALNGSWTTYNNTNQLYNVNTTYPNSDNIRIGWDNNYGPLDGQINEMIVFENNLDSIDKIKVESYLAIKYGRTLADGQKDYLNSNGDIVWSATTNSGFNANIAGIAYDKAGSLNQLQSWSTEKGMSQVLIGTLGLDNTNAENTDSLTDGQFLIWGDNGENRTPSVTISGNSDVNYRFASVWKVQNTNNLGTVRVAWPAGGFTNFSLVQSGDSDFGSGNTFTNMTSNVIAINGIDYNYADVNLADGSYFTFAALVASPGGVSADLRVWLRSDMGFSPEKWNDLSGFSNDYTQTNADRQPFLSDKMYNFNPAADFGGATATDARFMALPAGGPYTADNLSSTIFTMALNHAFDGWNDVIGFGGTTTTPNLTQAGLPTITTHFNNLQLYPALDANIPSQQPLKKETLYLYDASFTFGVGGITYGINGDTGSVATVLNAAQVKFNSGSILGSQPEVKNGLIPEVIAYERDLTPVEKMQVRTYLGIKYGMTLSHNYLASNGTTVVWDMAANDGYNNDITGIARDNGGSLDQKQSKSINDENEVLISTLGLDQSNAANNQSLPNNQYLVIGWDSGFKAPSVAINTISGINNRFGAIWKVQNTGNVDTVRVAWPRVYTNMKLIQSNDNTFDNSDEIVDMNHTMNIDGTIYSYADVKLKDGHFFTFGAFLQSPGGVAGGLMMWHKADDATANSGKKTIWRDVSGNLRDVTQSIALADTAKQPTFVENGLYSANNGSDQFFFNFNPFYYFGGNSFFFRDNDAYFPDKLSAGSAFSVVYNTKLPHGWETSFGWSDDDPNLVRNGNHYEVWADNGHPNADGSLGNQDPSSLKANIAGMGWQTLGTGANAGEVYLFNNGYVNTSSPISWSELNSQNNFAIGSEGLALSTSGNERFFGSIGEVFGYSVDYKNNSTNHELDRINTYLAIKYGITLKNQTGDGPANYYATDETIVWDTTVNDGYNNNIAGIAHDYTTALMQKQSISENDGQQVLIGTTGLTNSNAANDVDVPNDMQYLVWGDNGEARAPSVYQPNMGHGINVLFKSVWKVQNTGNVSTVRVAWPKQYDQLTLIQSSDDVFDSGDDFTDMTNNLTVINDQEYYYADVTLSDGQYFTFGTKIDHAPGGVFAGLSHWFRADKQLDTVGNGSTGDVALWTDFAFRVPATQIAGVDVPKYHEGDSAYLNFNPGVNFTTVLQKLGNINIQTLTSLDFDIFSATKEGMAGLRYFNIGMDNTTMNGANWDNPGLYANGNFGTRDNKGLNAYVPSVVPLMAANSPSIMYYHLENETMYKMLNGGNRSIDLNHVPTGPVTGGFIFGANSGAGTSGDDNGILGSIGDLIVYGNGSITKEERNKVDAYLALKYGITLVDSADYINSTNDTLFYSDEDNGFYHNVAGIVGDEISSLYQKQGRSQITNNPNDQVIIALGAEVSPTNNKNMSNLDNGQALVWGDNDQTKSLTQAFLNFSYNGNSDNRRMTRTWKVRNTDNLDDLVTIQFPVSSVGSTTIPNEGPESRYVLITANDSAFTSGVQVTELNVVGDNYQVGNSFDRTVKYFTFGKVVDFTIPTPIKLQSFTAEAVQGTSVLDWTTAIEMNNRGFEVQRSFDGSLWNNLGFVSSKAEMGNSSSPINYRFIDNQPKVGKNLYRLRQVDLDGRSTFSEVRSVVFDAQMATIKIYPNPVRDNVTITGLVGHNDIVVTNILGQVVIRTDASQDSKTVNTGSLISGAYFIKIIDEQGHEYNFKIVKD